MEGTENSNFLMCLNPRFHFFPGHSQGKCETSVGGESSQLSRDPLKFPKRSPPLSAGKEENKAVAAVSEGASYGTKS